MLTPNLGFTLAKIPYITIKRYLDIIVILSDPHKLRPNGENRAQVLRRRRNKQNDFEKLAIAMQDKGHYILPVRQSYS